MRSMFDIGINKNYNYINIIERSAIVLQLDKNISNFDISNLIKGGSKEMDLRQSLDIEKAKLDEKVANEFRISAAEKRAEIEARGEEAKANSITNDNTQLVSGIKSKYEEAYTVIENLYATLPQIQQEIGEIN